MRTSVGFTSDEYTSLPTIGQNGTFGPSSAAIAMARAVYCRVWREVVHKKRVRRRRKVQA